jgi:hypothetical protein
MIVVCRHLSLIKKRTVFYYDYLSMDQNEVKKKPRSLCDI